MEDEVWDDKNDTEEERDNVKLLYKLHLDDLLDDEQVAKRYKNIQEGGKDPDVPHSASAFTMAVAVPGTTCISAAIFPMGTKIPGALCWARYICLI